MNLFQKALFYISVPKCVSCGERLVLGDRGLCGSCYSRYLDHKMRDCSICGKVLSRCICSKDRLKRRYIRKLVKLFRYITRDPEENDSQRPSNMLIYSLKRDNREDVLSFLADELSEAIRENIGPDESFVVTSIPRRREAVKKYGIDHAELLGRAVAKRLGLKYYRLLRSTTILPQKKMQELERVHNASFDYLKKTPDIKGKRVILIDDVVTSGASLGAAAMLIHALGAKEIVGATVSIAYRDKKIDFTPPPKPPEFRLPKIVYQSAKNLGYKYKSGRYNENSEEK